MDRSLFDHVLDALEGFVADVRGTMRSSVHTRGVKVWFDDATREHYEAQLVRVDGDVVLEVGFHAEHPKPDANDAVLATLCAERPKWSGTLGPDPVAGEFLGAARWRRISEVWPAPEPADDDAAIEIAARLADYIRAFEPIRRR